MTFMYDALESAKQGVTLKEGGPFGACIVKEGKLISVAHNTVLRDKDPTCHAEMNAIRLAAKTLGTHDLSGCELYTTSEPCPMCLSASYWSNISKITIGVSRECAARFGFRDDLFYEELQLDPSKRLVPCTFGLLESEIENLFRTWQQSAGELY